MLALVLTSCGATTVVDDVPEEDPAEWTEQAAEAWAELEPRRAARLAERAIAAGAEDDAKEIAARAYLAHGRNTLAIRVLSGTDSPALLRLRARAQLADDAHDGALESLTAARRHMRDGEEDPWTEAMHAALTATLDGDPPYAVRGSEAELALEELPLPVVHFRADTFEGLALIGTGAEITVLDPSVRNEPGRIDELVLGDITIERVPHTVRSLEPISEALGRPIAMVLGADLLLRLHARLDGPGNRLTLFGERPDFGTTHTDFLTLSGSFLAIEARIGGANGWLTVDTAGLFPVALAPGGDEAFGIQGQEWDTIDERISARMTPQMRVGSLEMHGIPVIRGLLEEAHARAVGAPVAGAIGWTLLRQLRIGFDRERRALVFE